MATAQFTYVIHHTAPVGRTVTTMNLSSIRKLMLVNHTLLHHQLFTISLHSLQASKHRHRRKHRSIPPQHTTQPPQPPPPPPSQSSSLPTHAPHTRRLLPKLHASAPARMQATSSITLSKKVPACRPIPQIGWCRSYQNHSQLSSSSI